MPQFTFTQSIAAGTSFDPLAAATGDWQYKYLPNNCVVELIDDATAVGIVKTVTFGSDTIQQESPVSSGGTAGRIPARINQEPLTDKAEQGDLVQIRYRNTTAGAVTVNGIVQITKV